MDENIIYPLKKHFKYLFIVILSVNTSICFANNYFGDSVLKYNKKHKKITYKPKTSEEIFNEIYGRKDSLTPNYNGNEYRKSNNETYNSSPENKVNSITYSPDENSVMGQLAKMQTKDSNNEKDGNFLIYILAGLFLVIVFSSYGLLKNKFSESEDTGDLEDTKAVTKIIVTDTNEEDVNQGKESSNIILKIVIGIVLLFVLGSISKWLGCQRHHGDGDSNYTRGFR